VRNCPGVRLLTLRSKHQADLAGAADIEVSRESPSSKKMRPVTGLVEYLGERELGLQDGELVAIARGAIAGRKRDAVGVAAICAASDRSYRPTARRTAAASTWDWHKT